MSKAEIIGLQRVRDYIANSPQDYGIGGYKTPDMPYERNFSNRDDLLCCVDREIRRLDKREAEGEELLAEVKAWLDSMPDAIRVCEGGGPENLAASFAVNVYRLTKAAPHPKSETQEQDAKLLVDLDEYLKYCPDPNVVSEFFIKNPSLLLWRCREALRRNRDTENAALAREAIGWTTPESMKRLKEGGNGSRKTVPLHAEPTLQANIPVFLGTQSKSLDSTLRQHLKKIADDCAANGGIGAIVSNSIHHLLRMHPEG